jgi:hypothetical protein
MEEDEDLDEAELRAEMENLITLTTDFMMIESTRYDEE